MKAPEQTEEQRHRQTETEIKTDRKTDTYTDRQTDRQRKSDRQTETETEIESKRGIDNKIEIKRSSFISCVRIWLILIHTQKEFKDKPNQGSLQMRASYASGREDCVMCDKTCVI